MEIINDLAKLYNTLMLINTKGEDTKNMSNYKKDLEGTIAREQAKAAQQNQADEFVEETEE